MDINFIREEYNFDNGFQIKELYFTDDAYKNELKAIVINFIMSNIDLKDRLQFIKSYMLTQNRNRTWLSSILNF